MSKASLAWLLQQEGTDVVIVGASTPQQMADNSEIIKLNNVSMLYLIHMIICFLKVFIQSILVINAVYMLKGNKKMQQTNDIM